MEIEKGTACCFQLRSFAPGSAPRGLKISGSMGRRPGSFRIEYRVEGNLEKITRPTPVPGPTRRHELWRQTCFEFFFGTPGECAYWEGNLSPCGAWNVYRFSDHRQEMREEKAVGRPVCRMETQGGQLLFSCTIDIRGICKDCIPLEAGIACVVEDVQGAVSYWAIDHCGPKPDFHDRRSFLLKLPAID